MSKPRRKPRKRPSPPLPAVGRYVLAFEAPDGSLHDPPIPPDQRITDDELKDIVRAAWAKLIERYNAAETVNRVDALPCDIKLEDRTSSDPLNEDAPSRPTKSYEPEDFEAALRRQPAFEEAPPSAAQIAEEAGLTASQPLPKDPEPPSAHHTPISPATSSADTWVDAAGSVLFWGACIAVGSFIAGAAAVAGGSTILKLLLAA